MNGIACDRRIDNAGTKSRRTLNQSQINLDDLAAGELRRESAVRCVGFRHDQATTGLFVEAMDDPGAIDAADVRKLPEMMQQAGNQGPPDVQPRDAPPCPPACSAPPQRHPRRGSRAASPRGVPIRRVSAGSRQTISSSGRTICEAFARAPLRSTPPERITAWILERETAGKHSASQRSSRLPALAEETLKTRCPRRRSGRISLRKNHQRGIVNGILIHLLEQC